MQPPENDALLDFIPSEEFQALVELYDRFAHSIDPYDPARDKAERIFADDLQALYDGLGDQKPSFHLFQKLVIRRIKRQIARDMGKPPRL